MIVLFTQSASSVPAVVVNANNIMALLPIRSLGRKGIPVTCLFGQGGHAPYASCIRWSRYISKRYAFSETEYERNMVTALCQIGKSTGRKSVLFPVSDFDMITISANRERLEKYYHLLMPPHDLLASLLNKNQFYRLAHSHNFPIPKTFTVDGSTDIALLAQDVPFPCVIKPAWRDQTWTMRYGHQKVLVAHDAEELKASLRYLLLQFPPMIVQEIIPGGEDRIVCSFAYLNRDSESIGIFTSKKIRQFPPHFGNSAMVQAVREPSVVGLTKRICKELGMVGYASIEFKKDPRDNEWKIIEITPARFNRQSGLSEQAGFSIPYVWYCHLLNMPVESIVSDVQCKWVSEVNDLRAFREYQHNGEYRLKEWIKEYRDVTSCEVFSRDDLLPFIMLLPSAVSDWTCQFGLQRSRVTGRSSTSYDPR